MTKYKILQDNFAVVPIYENGDGKLISVFDLYEKKWYQKKYRLCISSSCLSGVADYLANTAIREGIFKNYGASYKPVKFSFSLDDYFEPEIKGNHAITYKTELDNEQKKELIEHISTKLKAGYDKQKLLNSKNLG